MNELNLKKCAKIQPAKFGAPTKKLPTPTIAAAAAATVHRHDASIIFAQI